jgi:malate dehydrogenase
VTTLDVVRANTFISGYKVSHPAATHRDASSGADITVIGGHAGTTIIPLLSQVPELAGDEEAIKSLTHRIQFGGDEVVQAKEGQGSATLSMVCSFC